MRDIVRLHFIGGVSYVEVAEQLFLFSCDRMQKAQVLRESG